MTTDTEDPRDLSFWAIDPGDVHVGIAEFRGGRCQTATETRPQALEDRLYEALFRDRPHGNPAGGVAYPDLLVVERFALRGELMAQQQGSEFLTSQLIGSLRCLCRIAGVPLVIQTPQQHKTVLKRQPWKDWPLRRWTSYGHGPHAKSAELHGNFFIQERLRELGTTRMQEWLDGLG